MSKRWLEMFLGLWALTAIMEGYFPQFEVGMRQWLMLVALGAWGCSPKGQPPAVPTSLKSAQANLASPAEKTVIPPEDSFQQGLPSFCETRTDAGKGCLVCRVGELPLERCFAESVNFDPNKTCTFDKQQLKCLVADSLTVVKISFQDSDEKRVLDDWPVILSNIKAIVGHSENKDADEVAALFAMLDFIEANSRAILLGQRPDELAAQLARTLNVHGKKSANAEMGDLEKTFITGMKRLREETLRGQLDDADGLQFVRDLALLFVKSERTARMLKTMSLDGLKG